MGTIQITDEESTLLIDQPDESRYRYAVDGADIWFHTEGQTPSEGKRARDGDTGRVRVPANVELLARAVDAGSTATLEMVDVSRMDVSTDPRRTIETPQDAATRLGQWDFVRSGIEVADGATETVDMSATGGIDSEVILEGATVICNEQGDAIATEKLAYLLQVQADDGTVLFESTANGPDARIVVPGIPVPADGVILIQIRNFVGDGSTAGVETDVKYREVAQ